MKKTKLISFLLRISEDSKLYPSHCFLLIALFSIYHQEKCVMPFQISRSRLMQLAKVNSIVTYHKSIKELVNYGYILYEPSYDPIKGSTVYLTEELIGRN